MLTADLVQTRRRGDVLQIVPLGDEERSRALALGAAYVDLARSHVGLERGALLEALRGVPVAARERRLADGLLKLVLDRCGFEEAAALEPGPLRAELFAAATTARREATGATFDRAAVVAAVAAARGVSPAAIDQALYADLPDAHRLQTVDLPGPRELLSAYEQGQVQAVLLRAVKVTAHVQAAPGAYRALFRKLKFLRLLHQIRRADKGGGYAIEIDGPFSLFESVTKYGLQLALAYPAIAACEEWRLEAEVRWGKERRPLLFKATNARAEPPAGEDQTPVGLPDEVAALHEALQAQEGPWRPRIGKAVLDLPGVGVCIPDLELVHAESGQTVYLEALGFWSRDAVWKRIELVHQGLPFPIVFAVSKHLRVSEAALDDQAPAALYVYARTMSPKAILERVEKAAAAAR